MEHIEQKEKERFINSYTVSGDCYLWNKYLDKDGYGTFYFRKKSRKAHRVAVFMMQGTIPEKMVVDHICKNRSCVNVAHLRVITARQNTLENSKSVGAINKMKEFCKMGHKFDKFYGKQRYCSICSSEKSKRLQKKWREEANKTMC